MTYQWFQASGTAVAAFAALADKNQRSLSFNCGIAGVTTYTVIVSDGVTFALDTVQVTAS